MTGNILIAVISVWIPCGLVSYFIARSKRQQGWIWLIAGLLFGPIGLAGAALFKDKQTTGATAQTSTS